MISWIEKWLTSHRQWLSGNGSAFRVDFGNSWHSTGVGTDPLCYVDLDFDMCWNVLNLLMTPQSCMDRWQQRMMWNLITRWSNIRDDLNWIYEWRVEWQMLFNTSKCKLMHVGSKNPMNHITMNGVVLEVVEQEKDLGVLIHMSLNTTLKRRSRQCC